MAPEQLEIARILREALLDMRAPDDTRRQAVSDAASALGMRPESFFMAAAMMAASADEYMDRQREIAQILEIVKAPVRVDVVSLNTRPLAAKEALRLAFEQGQHAFLTGRPIHHTALKGLRRSYFARGWRYQRREALASDGDGLQLGGDVA